MSEQDLKLRIGADAADFDSVVSSVQAGSKRVAENMSRIGGAVSGAGATFAQLDSGVGRAFGSVGQLASTMAVGGPLALGLAAISLGVSSFVTSLKAAHEATRKLREEQLKKLATDAKNASDDFIAAMTENAKAAEKADPVKAAQEKVRGYQNQITQLESQLTTKQNQIRASENDADLSFKKGYEAELSVLQNKHSAAFQRLQAAEKELSALNKAAAEAGARSAKTDASEGEKFGSKAGGIDPLHEYILKRNREDEERARKAREERQRDEHEYLVWRGAEEERYAKEYQDEQKERLKLEKELREEKKKAADEQARALDAEMAARFSLSGLVLQQMQMQNDNAAKTTAAIQDYTSTAISMSTDIASNYVAMWTQMAHARERGDLDTWERLKAAEQDYWMVVTSGILGYIGQKFAAEGALLMARGAAESALGNPGGPEAIAIGAAMAAAGGGAMIAGAWAGAESGARQEDASYRSNQAQQGGGSSSAPSGSVGYGASARSAGGGPTIVYNTYNIGVAVGPYDDACRQIADMNNRGRDLG